MDFFNFFIVLCKETKTELAITAGLWFATVTFKSGTRCSREFILDSLKLCYESGMADDIIPNWHSYGIFTPVSYIPFSKCNQSWHHNDSNFVLDHRPKLNFQLRYLNPNTSYKNNIVFYYSIERLRNG